MGQGNMITCAAIDIGSNTIIGTVARCDSYSLEIIKDESTLFRMGEDVKKKGEISTEKRDALLEIVRKYVDAAKQHDASPVLAVATQAMRDARNHQIIVDDIQRETGVQVNLIPGEVEAALTYHGATYGQDIPPDAAVLDVGGGSTELILARQHLITWLTSFPIGSGWLHDQFLLRDPLAEDEEAEARQFVSHYIQNFHIPYLPLTLIVTGSTAKALFAMSKQILKLDEQSQTLTRQDISGCLNLLQTMSAEKAAQRYGMEIGRAKILPAGCILIEEMMSYLHLDEIRISEYGIRHGVLLAYVRYGEEWLKHPEVKVDDSRVSQPPPIPKSIQGRHAPNETFMQSGRDELLKRTDKFLSWRDDVLKNQDVEAVHKMRVASRRLRATMDAYESICAPKPFRQTYRRVKQVADLLGTARDIDVMTLYVRQMLEQAPQEKRDGVQWFIDRLNTCRKYDQQKLEARLQNLQEKAFEQRMEASLASKGGSRGQG